jgi:dipeptidyl aminopeptidase/acylaminoacyl peptidase
VIFSRRLTDGYQIEVLSVDTREKKMILEGGRSARYVETGHLIYEQAGTGNLMAAPFDLTSLEVTGDPVPVVQGVRGNLPGYVDYAVSDNGTLVYLPGGTNLDHKHSFVWVDRQGTETLLTQEERNFNTADISPNGEFFTVSIFDETTGNRNVWIYDLKAESLSRLTFEEESNGMTTWSPDSKMLVFQAGGGSQWGLFRQPADRSRPPERLTTSSNRQMPHSWSPDGQVVAFTESGRPGGFDIAILPVEEEGEPEYFITTPASECCAVFSPDGKWLAYVSNETGADQVYVRPYPEPDVKWLISGDGGGQEPVWSPGGEELFYRSGNRMMVVSIQAKDQTLTAGSPRVLFEGSYVNHSTPPGLQYYDTSDGKRFLMLKEGDVVAQSQINVVLNWFEELKRLVPTN